MTQFDWDKAAMQALREVMDLPDPTMGQIRDAVVGAAEPLIRNDERVRLTRDEGWFTDEAHEAVVASAKVRSQRFTLDRLRSQVFDLQEEAWIEYRGAVPGDVKRVALMCAMIESYKNIITIIDKELG